MSKFKIGNIRPIPGYENLYSVSADGKVFSHIRNRYLKLYINSRGYLRVVLSINGSVKGHPVHRLVALAWIENPNNYDQINHLNGNKSDNNVVNLEWCNQSMNIKHAWDNGFYDRSVISKTGKKCWKNNVVNAWKKSRKITYGQAQQIRDIYALGNVSMKKLSKKFNLAYGSIFRIIHNTLYVSKQQ